MLNKHTLIILATLTAVYFTSLVYLLPSYANLWFTLEFIILPIVYIIGYERLMKRQDQIYKKDLELINQKSLEADMRYTKLKKENIQLKKKLPPSSIQPL